MRLRTALMLAFIGLVGAIVVGKEEKVAIVWWFEPVLPERIKAIEEAFIKPYENLNPHIKIQLIPKPGIYDLLPLVVPVGKGPDIIMTMGPADAIRFAAAGFLVPLDFYVKEAGLDKLLAPIALVAGMYKEKIYSLPKTFESMGIIYNKTLFEEYGWKPPTNRKEWVALCEAIKAKGILPVAAGNAGWRPSNEWHVTVYLNHYAGPENVYKALTGELRWDDPIFVKAIEMFKHDFLNYWPALEEYFTLGWADYMPMVALRKAAMTVIGSWGFGWLGPEYWPSEDKWGWAPFPSLHEEVIYPLVAVGIGTTLSVAKYSKYPDEVAQFIVWMLSHKEGIAKLLRDDPGEWLVPIKIPKDLIPIKVDPVFIEHVHTQTGLLLKGAYGYTTWTFLGPETWTWCYEGIEKVWLGEITAKEYMEKWEEIFRKEFEAGLTPPVPKRG